MRLIAVLVVVLAASCSSPLCPGGQNTPQSLPNISCTDAFAGSYLCQSGTFFQCTQSACWGSMQDGPCAAVPGVPANPNPDIKLCNPYRGAAPTEPCDDAHVGDVWCIGQERYQCMPSPASCWAFNDGTQPCTTTR